MMRFVPTRKTATGQEYWDKELKLVVHYLEGQSPPEELIQTEGMVGQYSVGGKIAEAIQVKKVPVVSIEEMDIDQLREHAEENGIEIPGNMKKLETIRQHIIEELNAVADAE